MFINIINEMSLLYFFSTLAQCAAGFAALIGVFAVFRLQANAHSITEEYIHVKNWLSRESHHNTAVAFSREEVKYWLKRFRDQKQESFPAEEAGKKLDKIHELESLDSRLIYEASQPLKLWAVIFFLAIVIIPFTKLFLDLFILVFLILVCLVVYTLILTKRFIQKCLSF